MKTNEPIYTICKYSPLELLSGFGLKAERLDPNPASFSCAESCGHPNLCGYGKAVLEEVLTRNIRCLLLVDCCDVCRRIYDILLNRGGMKFLYLLPLPHKNGSGEITRMERELRRLTIFLSLWMPGVEPARQKFYPLPTFCLQAHMAAAPSCVLCKREATCR